MSDSNADFKTILDALYLQHLHELSQARHANTNPVSSQRDEACVISLSRNREIGLGGTPWGREQFRFSMNGAISHRLCFGPKIVNLGYVY